MDVAVSFFSLLSRFLSRLSNPCTARSYADAEHPTVTASRK
jgi:hypothetical protein